MLKKQIILSCVESKKYNKEGIASYTCGDFQYHIANVEGQPRVVSITIPEDFDLSGISVIVRQ